MFFERFSACVLSSRYPMTCEADRENNEENVPILGLKKVITSSQNFDLSGHVSTNVGVELLN